MPMVKHVYVLHRSNSIEEIEGHLSSGVRE